MPTQPQEPTTLDTSLIVQSVLTLICLLTSCYMWLSGHTPPDVLTTLTVGLVMYFFGGRAPASGVRQMAASIRSFAAAIE